MKTNKKNLTTQRQLLEKKLTSWLLVREDKRPPSGWVKAIRTALGLSTRQLAQRLQIQQPAVMNLEDREAKGKITLELLERAAKAMGCKLIYSIVPESPNSSLENIVNSRAKQLAADIVKCVEHSMRLEAQGSESIDAQIEKLAYELKQKMDSRLWEPNSIEKQTEKQKRKSK